MIWWIALALAPDADACSRAEHSLFTVDWAPNGRAPSPPEVLDTFIERGSGSTTQPGLEECADVGLIALTLDPAGVPGRYGYHLHTDGDLPDGLHIDPGPFLPAHEDGLDQLWLTWIDDAVDDQDPFDFTLTLIAIDQDGDESEPVDLTLDHSGIARFEVGLDSSICGTSSEQGAAWLLALLMLVSRRWRPYPGPPHSTGSPQS